jgi:hypothetical protein
MPTQDELAGLLLPIKNKYGFKISELIKITGNGSGGYGCVWASDVRTGIPSWGEQAAIFCFASGRADWACYKCVADYQSALPVRTIK